MNWTLEVYGPRGSFRAEGPEYETFGGGTSCYKLECGNIVVLDAGTGFLQLEKELTARAVEEPVHILLSHVHLDHIAGLFPSDLLRTPGAKVHIYGESRNGKDIREQLADIIRPPYWPVSIEDAAADVKYHTFSAGDSFTIGTVKVSTVRSPHPDICTLYRIEDKEHSFGYATDCEIAAAGNDVKDFYTGCSTLLMDGSFLPGMEKPGWGHSSWTQAADFCVDTGTDRLIISHHGRTSTDDVLEKQERSAKEYMPGCIFARKGTKVEL